jgi:DNA repair protein RecN (Recombination protein N)
MLRELRIRNFAVVENVQVAFAPGLNVLTGETGAGKSILIDALLLVRGARAQTEIIRTDTDAAVVEAVFEVDARGPVGAALDGAGLKVAEGGQVVIRREVARAGRHRAFVNDSPVTVGLLERLGDLLVEVHGQHEHQRVLEPSHQLDVLDRFAGTEALRERVAALFARHRSARAEAEDARDAERDRGQREELLRFQVSEIEAARIRPGEEQELRTELARLKNAERFTAGLTEASSLLVDDGQSVSTRLARVRRLLGDLARLDPAFARPVEALEAASVQVEDALLSMRSVRDRLAFEPGRLEAIDDRLAALGQLKRKYGETEEAMLAFREQAAAELERLARHEERLAEQERQVAELAADLAREAEALSTQRQEAARKLAAEAVRELKALGMEHAVFEVVVERQSQVSARGYDRALLKISTNPGEEPRALARIASGGELSRTMLALTHVLAAADPVATMVFDEVDAGIGAGVANAVAEKLAAVSAKRQVLCVTHLAPIGAAARHHLRVAKTVLDGRTLVEVATMSGDDRVKEIARMLAGDASTDKAQGHARELLERAQSR